MIAEPRDDHRSPVAGGVRARWPILAAAAVAVLWAVLLETRPLGGVVGAAAITAAALAGLAVAARRRLGLARWSVGHDTWLFVPVLVAHLAISYAAIPLGAAVVPLLGRQAAEVVFTATSGLPPVVVAGIAGLVVAPLEELWWRGTLQPLIGSLLANSNLAARPGAITLTTAAFVLFHLPTLQLPLMGAALVGGVAWGWLRERTDGLLAPVLAHAGWTAAMVLLPPT